MKTSKLEKFLINRNLLEKFKHNLHNNHPPRVLRELLIHNHTQRCLIDEAFIWYNTPEGEYFWNEVEDEWIECLENNTL